ncbi:hypothetical protein [uncultured Rhodospira sp.]|uniref:hypothetical protein n=1 Tax=uncultured Rhodospira sp. TaxID=1936189 RepID=UPI00261E4AEF|nr:hypothetical protein [uncultured Rhodospira sp.]
MAGQRVDEALQALGQAIARLEAAVTAREARQAEASAEGDRDDQDRTALRQEYELLRNDYHELRQVVEQVDGRLDGTVARLRALLEG